MTAWKCLGCAAIVIGLLPVLGVVALAQQPDRQPTRRVIPQIQLEFGEQPQPPPDGGEGRRPLRRVPGRTERYTPKIDPSTGRFQIRREIFVQPRRVGPRRIARRWRLGIEVDNAPKGLLITEVSQNSAAWRYGLEPGDYVLDVMGYPVGYYEGAYYALADTLNRFAQRDGWVNILIWNHRTDAEEAMWVQAESRRDLQVREN
jgi:hypothetical protein